MTIAVSIVEDVKSLRSIYTEWLSAAKDFRLVSQFGNGLQAVAALPQQNPDVVLMDINLPGLNGVECVRQLKPQMPTTQFVMFTAYDDPDRVFQALSAGATGYLLKETQRDDLLVSLRTVHGGGSPMSFDIGRKVVQFFQRPAPAGPQGELEALSTREQQVLELVGQGYLIKEIGEALQLSQHTVDNYLRRIYEKLHVHSRAQAAAKYAKLKLPLVTSRGQPVAA